MKYLYVTGASIGAEVRVVGNDAGEKLSILPGIIARLDRPAPNYGIGRYNDFNTFYLQAASSTSGGSSGSPVIDIHGTVVALNAGANTSSSASYYFPLDRVVRALDLIKHGDIVPRGTLQTEFEYKPFQHARKLGLHESVEESLRSTFPDRTGVLSVKRVVPGGPGSKCLENGDILYRIQGQLVSHFVELENYLDTNVEEEITLEFERNGKALISNVTVQDLHSITPACFLQFGDGIIHELSYQMARSYSIPVGAPYVASGGFCMSIGGIQNNSVIRCVKNTKTESFGDFVAALKRCKNNEEVSFKYASLASFDCTKVASVRIDSELFKSSIFQRNDESGFWNHENINISSENMPDDSKTRNFSDHSLEIPHAPWQVNQSLKSLALVQSHIPFLVEGTFQSMYEGAGVILDGVLGLLVCDRSAVPISACNVYVTFSNSVVLSVDIVFMHPFRNFVLLRYDPGKVGSHYLPGVELCSQSLDVIGNPTHLVVLGKDHFPMEKSTSIAKLSESHSSPRIPPRFRQFNTEVFTLENSVNNCLGGILIQKGTGKVQGFWFSYHVDSSTKLFSGLPAVYLIPALKSIRHWACFDIASRMLPDMNLMSTELIPVHLSYARKLGLPGEWSHRLTSISKDRHTLLQVSKCFPHLDLPIPTKLNDHGGSYSMNSSLQNGDIILSINGCLASRMLDIFHMEESLDYSQNDEVFEILILRDGEEKMVIIPPRRENLISSNKKEEIRKLTNGNSVRIPPPQSKPTLIGWCGTIIQIPYEYTLQQTVETDFMLKTVPYITCVLCGSPAESAGLTSGFYVLTVNDIQMTKNQPTMDRQDIINFWVEVFTDAMKSKNEFIILQVMNRDGVKKMLALSPDPHYWPSWILAPNQVGKWKMVDL